MLFFELAYTPFGYVGVGLLDAADEETFEAVADGAIGFVIHSTDGDDWTAAELVETPPFTELTWSDEALYGTFAGYGTWVWTPPES